MGQVGNTNEGDAGLVGTAPALLQVLPVQPVNGTQAQGSHFQEKPEATFS